MVFGRMRDRAISIADLISFDSGSIRSRKRRPGDWFKDFGSFKICGQGSFPKTFLLRGQAAKGEAVTGYLASAR